MTPLSAWFLLGVGHDGTCAVQQHYASLGRIPLRHTRRRDAARTALGPPPTCDCGRDAALRDIARLVRATADGGTVNVCWVDSPAETVGRVRLGLPRHAEAVDVPDEVAGCWLAATRERVVLCIPKVRS